MRNMQPANRVTPRPQPSPVTPPPVSTHPKRRCQTRGQQNSTESYKILRKLVCARARTRARGVSPPVIPTHSPVIPAKAGILVPLPLAYNKWSSPVIPALSHVIPAKAGILVPARAGDVSLLSAWNAPRPQQIRRITWSRRPRTLMPIDRTEPSERWSLLRGTVWVVLELENDGGAI